MTRAEILNCLTDRPCDVCRFHESGKCERWDCVFEEEPDDAEDCEDKRMTREEAIRALKYERKTALHENKGAFDMAIKALSAEPQKMGRWIKVTNGRGGHECDVCRTYAPSYTDGDEYLSAFCPYCGAKMAESEE